MLVIFEIGSHFIPGLAWTVIHLLVLPYVAWMIGAFHHAEPFLEMGSHKLFAQVGLEP
jgi:hypothetical protein